MSPFVAALAVALLVPAAAARAGTVTTLVNSSQNRPDTNSPWYVWGPPVLDGTHVVFLTKDTQVFYTLDGIWSYDLLTSTPVKLAGLGMKVPGGKTTFAGFGLFGSSDVPLPTAAGGITAFYGYDQNGKHGLYTVPDAGGTITRIIDTATTAPDGTLFTYFNGAQLNGVTIAFYAQTAGGSHGIYSANVSGHQLKKVIDGSTNLDARGYGGGANYYGTYTGPSIGKSEIDVFATGIGDPSIYPNEVFGTVSGGFSGRADNLTVLQGDKNAATTHTQIYGRSAARESNAMAFAAYDQGYSGIFAAAGAGTQAARLVSITTKVPGTADTFMGFGGFALDASGLAFVGSDATNGQSIYFRPAGGASVPVLIASGNTYYYPTLGERALQGGQLVFFDGSIFSNAIYLATLP